MDIETKKAEKKRKNDSATTRVMFVAFEEIEEEEANQLNMPEDIRNELRAKAKEFVSLLRQLMPRIVEADREAKARPAVTLTAAQMGILQRE